MRRRAETTNLVILPTTFLTPEKGITFTRLTGLVDPRGTSSVAWRRVQQQSSRQQRHHPKKGFFIPPCHSREQSVSCLAATSNANYLKEAYRRHIRVPFCAQWRSKDLILSISFTDFTSIYLSLHNPGILSPETSLSTSCRCIGRTFIGKDLSTNNHCHHYSEASWRSKNINVILADFLLLVMPF